MARLVRAVAAVCAVMLAVSGCGALEEAARENRVAEETSEVEAEDAAEGTTEREQENAAGDETETPAKKPFAETEGPEALTKEPDDESAETPGFLPARYDAREDGRTSPVKNQGDLGTCWAFASLLALESSLLPDEVFDFSEDHMSQNPNFALEQKEGGDYIMAMAYLLSWQGPVLEEDDPYGDGVSPEGLTAVKHVQEIKLLPEKDLGAIKQAVYTTGGVQSSLYTTMRTVGDSSEYYNQETRAYVCPEDRDPNHDVVIVGWDDDFPKESFPLDVAGNGAFLCENSWGTQFGEDGFFYVSYYDANLGKTNLLYSRVEDVEDDDRIYQSDLCGWIGQLGYGEETAWAVNVYRSGTQDERLKAVGFYATDQDTDYEIYVVPDVPEDPSADDWASFAGRRTAASGHLDYGGYYTVALDQEILLHAGTRFGVMIRLTTPGVIHPIAIEYDTGDGKSRIDLSDGEGYISPDGREWENTEQNQSCNLCLKAYTSVTD